MTIILIDQCKGNNVYCVLKWIDTMMCILFGYIANNRYLKYSNKDISFIKSVKQFSIICCMLCEKNIVLQ